MSGMIGAAFTVLVVVAFAAIVWAAYSPRFKKKHEQDGMIPFLDSSTPPDVRGDDKTRI